MGLRELAGQVNRVLGRTNSLMSQLTKLSELLRRNAPAEKEAGDEAAAALKELRTFRDEALTRPLQGLGYRQYPRLREEVQSLFGSVSRTVNRPTDPQVKRGGELAKETAEAEQRLNAIINGRIAKLNGLLKGMPRIVLPGGKIS